MKRPSIMALSITRVRRYPSDNSNICRLNSGGYGGCGLGIVASFFLPSNKVSTKPCQVQRRQCNLGGSAPA